MPYDKQKHHRRSMRLPGHDYASSGAYFVTICVHGGKCLMGEVADGEMQLNDWGQIARAEWLASEGIRRELELDSFVVMPNHVHGIVWITEGDDMLAKAVDSHGPGAHSRAPLQRPPKSLGSFVAGYKSVVTRRINQLREMPGAPFWQRNYWEHVIRNEASLDRIRQYIENNPARWAEDQLHPDAPPNPFNQWQP
jgi:putative transposase